MQRVDGYYLYTVGMQIHPLSELRGNPSTYGKPMSLDEARLPVLIAEGALEPLLARSVFKLRTSVQPGDKLLAAIRSLKEKIVTATDGSALLDWMDAYMITSAMTAFEAVLQAELALLPLYVVEQKAGYDTTTLIEVGANCFPSDLPFKVPEAVQDIQQGTRCVAFELNTAAGFHLHRANEAVIRRYWDVVSNGAERPSRGNMGDYFNQMKHNNFGDEIVRGALEHLVKFHRNPLIHPEQNIENSDDAIALMNSIHNAMVQMLKVIPADLSAFGVPVGSFPAQSS